MKKSNNMFFVFCIMFIFCWVLYLFKSFWLTITIGSLLALSTSIFHQKLLVYTNNKNLLSSILVTVLLCLIFLLPFVYSITQIVIYSSNIDTNQISKAIEYIKNFDLNLPSRVSFIEPKIKELFASVDLNALGKQALTYLSNIGKSGLSFVVDMVFIVIFFFFSNLYGTRFFKLVKEEIPMEDKQINYIFNEVSNTMSVVFYSTISNAILQGVLFGIIASIFGYNGFLLGIIFAFSSLIPAIGGALIYVPISIYEYLSGDLAGALIIFFYSVIMISGIADTLIKPLIIKFINSKLVTKPANINELAIFFAMIAGISSFGFWGVILGPAILTLFLATTKSYRMLKENQI